MQKNLFQIDGKPLEFCVYRGNMLQIKYNQLKKRIVDFGGIIRDYDDENKHNCIILADGDDEQMKIEVKNTFKSSYIYKCIKKNKLLGIKKYRLNKIDIYSRNDASKSNLPIIGKYCPDLDSLTISKCKHVHKSTIEEDLQDMERMLILRLN